MDKIITSILSVLVSAFSTVLAHVLKDMYDKRKNKTKLKILISLEQYKRKCLLYIVSIPLIMFAVQLIIFFQLKSALDYSFNIACGFSIGVFLYLHFRLPRCFEIRGRPSRQRKDKNYPRLLATVCALCTLTIVQMMELPLPQSTLSTSDTIYTPKHSSPREDSADDFIDISISSTLFANAFCRSDIYTPLNYVDALYPMDSARQEQSSFYILLEAYRIELIDSAQGILDPQTTLGEQQWKEYEQVATDILRVTGNPEYFDNLTITQAEEVFELAFKGLGICNSPPMRMYTANALHVLGLRHENTAPDVAAAYFANSYIYSHEQIKVMNRPNDHAIRTDDNVSFGLVVRRMGDTLHHSSKVEQDPHQETYLSTLALMTFIISVDFLYEPNEIAHVQYTIGTIALELFLRADANCDKAFVYSLAEQYYNAVRTGDNTVKHSKGFQRDYDLLKRERPTQSV